MFYLQDILTKRKGGGLGIIWLAATLGAKTQLKRLSKKEVNSVNIRQACNYILSPPEPLALRLSSNLLLGVIRIYQQQYHFFENEVSSLWVKVTSEKALTPTHTLPVTEARSERLTLQEQPYISLEAFLANALADSQSQPQEKVDYYAKVPTDAQDSSFSVPSGIADITLSQSSISSNSPTLAHRFSLINVSAPENALSMTVDQEGNLIYTTNDAPSQNTPDYPQPSLNHGGGDDLAPLEFPALDLEDHFPTITPSHPPQEVVIDWQPFSQVPPSGPTSRKRKFALDLETQVTDSQRLRLGDDAFLNDVIPDRLIKSEVKLEKAEYYYLNSWLKKFAQVEDLRRLVLAPPLLKKLKFTPKGEGVRGGGTPPSSPPELPEFIATAANLSGDDSIGEGFIELPRGLSPPLFPTKVMPWNISENLEVTAPRRTSSLSGGNLQHVPSSSSDGISSSPIYDQPEGVFTEVLISEELANSGLNQETLNFHRYLAKLIEKSGIKELHFMDLIIATEREGKRVTAAQAFYHLLALATSGLVEPRQAEPFADIQILLLSSQNY